MSVDTPKDRGAVGIGVLGLLGIALAGGLLLGVVLGSTGAVDLVSEPAATADPAYASYFDCPGGDEIGTFARGDRVFLTGRDASGEWVEVRSPLSASERVWMRARQVLADESDPDLPILDCHRPVAAIVSTTTTTAGNITTTTAGETSTTTTTTIAATTTTVPPPVVITVTDNPDPIWEKYPGFPNTCPGDGITTISVTLTAPAGVQSVTMSWSGVGDPGSAPMTGSGGTYSGDIGPFDANDPNGVPQDQSATLTVIVTVTDDLGRQDTGSTNVTVEDCTFS